MTTPAPKRGLVSDEPTGLRSWQVRPVGLSDGSGVRTGSSNAVRIDSCAVLSASSSTTSDTAGARAGDLAVRERRRTRLERRPAAAAEPDGEGGKREAVAGAVWCGCGAALDPRRITVRRQPNGRVRLCVDVIRGVRGGAVRGRLL